MADTEKVYFVNGGKYTKVQMVCKGLEQCAMPSDYETQCGDCPYFGEWKVEECKKDLVTDTLSVIRELQAENERLRKEKDNAVTVIQDLKEEIKELRMTACG